MLDKIVLSSDRKTATIICTEKTFTIYSDVDVMSLVDELLFKVEATRQRSEEDTDVIDLQLSFDIVA